MTTTTSYPLFAEITLSVTISGSSSKDPNPSLVFLHFWGGSSHTYSQLTSQLSSRHRCISISFRGWGLSSGPQDAAAYSMLHLATDIEALLPQIIVGEFVLIGHSMGGKVAQLIAGRQRLPGLRGLILLAPAPPTPLVLPEAMREQQIEAYFSRESAEFVIRNVLSAMELAEEVVDGLVDDMVGGNELAKKAWPAYEMGEDVLEEARSSDVPVLVIAGEKDKVEIVERVRREVVGNIKGAKIVVLEGKGHLLPVEAPVEVGKLVNDFIIRNGLLV